MSTVITCRGFSCQFAAPSLQVLKFSFIKTQFKTNGFVVSFAFCGQIVIEKIKLASCKTHAKSKTLLGGGPEKELEQTHLQLWVLLVVRDFIRHDDYGFLTNQSRSTASVLF